MIGFVNRAIQAFVCDTYGEDVWRQVAVTAHPGIDRFEPMLVYDDALTGQTLSAAAALTDRTVDHLLEDLGTYLVSHPRNERVRRLLRFGGESYVEFLYSLEDLPDRVRLAMPELSLPRMTLDDRDHDFTLNVAPGLPGLGQAMTGVLRALADDFGALVMLDHHGDGARGSRIEIRLHDAAFAEGRAFSLAEAGEAT